MRRSALTKEENMKFEVLRKIEKILKAVVPVAAVLIYCLHTEGCANTTQGPTGGPKDTLPPVIVGRIPDTVLTNFPIFKGKILINFNEYVQLKDANNEVIFSPPLKKRPTIKIKKKGVMVSFPDSLKANQTYTINFGNAILDVNENNPFPNYVYTFSTGKSIDSLIISGTVMDYETLLPQKGITIGVYVNPKDSSVMNDMPVAMAKTDEWGYFCLRGLKRMPYTIYAYKDANNNSLYDAGSELVGFCDSTITPKFAARKGMPQIAQMKMKDTLGCLSRPSETDIYLFKEISKNQYISHYGRTAERAGFVKFNAEKVQIDSFSIKGIYNDKLIKQFNVTEDSLCFWINDRRRMADTLSLRINYYKTDTLGQLKPAGETLKLALVKEKKKTDANKNKYGSDAFRTDGKNKNGNSQNNKRGQNSQRGNKNNALGQQKEERKDLLNMTMEVKPETVESEGYSFTFPAPLIKSDINKIRFTSTTPRKITTAAKFTFTKDSTNLLHYTLQAEEPYKVGNDYEITIPKGIFMDINGFTNDSTSKKITLPTDDKLSSITLEIKNTHGGKYLVEMVNEKRDKVYQKYTVHSDCSLIFPYLKTGNYSFRITEDKNGNGRLDIGSILEKKEPEKARLLKLSDGKSIIKVKESTDLTQEVNLDTIFKK
jgi:hypothetical protein